MSKRAILACLLAVMMLLTSCSLVVKDPAVDAAQVIVRVGDVTHTKAEVVAQTNEYLAYLQNIYATNYGFNYDITDAQAIASAQDAVINGMIREDVIAAKMTAMNITLTDEEMAAIDTEWAETRELLVLMAGASELPAEEQEVAVNALAQYYGVSRDQLVYDAKYQKMTDVVVADVKVTDEEVKADYDAKVEADKTSFAANVSAYGTAVMNGQTIYYRPAGYRMVKSILLQVNTADADALTAKATTQKNLADALKKQIGELENGAELDVDALAASVNVVVENADVVATATDLTATVTDTLPDIDANAAQLVREYKTAVTLQAAYEAQAAAAREAAWADAEARADAVLAELAAGADWDETMKAKTDDPGMKSGATAENGYAVCAGFTSFTAAYVDGAMALANVGDVSGKVKDDNYGYFIIKYVSDVAEGAVELADVQESIRANLLKTRQNEVLNATVDQWVKDAGAKINKAPLAN